MNWKEYSSLEGRHAVLSPSKHYWINYSDEKFCESYKNELAKREGTELHELAAMLIRKHQKLPSAGNAGKKTLNNYVNDAIGFRMRVEQPLAYSDNCFGHADAICFNEKDKFLRIHDLKTGVIPAKMDQLEIYMALFCLDYGYLPGEISAELRIYQNDQIVYEIPETEKIAHIIDRIKREDELIEKMNREMEG